MSLLLEAPQAIRKYFKEGPLYLKLEYDREIPDYVDLWLLIATDLGPEEAIDKLDEFDYGWWFSVSELAHGKLEIATDL